MPSVPLKARRVLPPADSGGGENGVSGPHTEQGTCRKGSMRVWTDLGILYSEREGRDVGFADKKIIFPF